jgi:hypothetical protein
MEGENWRHDRILYRRRWRTGRGRQGKGKGHPRTGYEAPKGSISEDNMKIEFMGITFVSVWGIQNSQDLYSSKVGFVVIRIFRKKVKFTLE